MFYNPYMKGGFDPGQGISDIVNQITQLLLMKKLYGNQQGQGQSQGAPIPQQPNLGGATYGQVQQGMGQMPGMSQLGQQSPMSQMSGTQMNQLSPQLIQMIKMIMGGQGGGGATGGMGGGLFG